MSGVTAGSLHCSARASGISSVANHRTLDREAGFGFCPPNHGLELSCGRRRAQGDTGLGVGGDRMKAIEHSVAMRRVGRHGHAIGVHAAEEGRNEVESRRIDKQYALAGKAHVLQVGSDGAGSPVELSVCHDGLIGLAVKQIRKCSLIRTILDEAAQHMDQITGILMRTNLLF